MIDLKSIITLVLALVILFLLFKRRNKYSLEQIKELIINADKEIHEAHNNLQISHKRLDELYKAIVSIEQGKVKGGNK